MALLRRDALLQYAGVYDVKAGVLGDNGELTLGVGGKGKDTPGRRTGSIWMFKKRQKFPYAWQRRLFVLLPTELRLRYFKEDEDALVACGCVDLRSLTWVDGTHLDSDGEEKMVFEARQIDKRRNHSFELKAMKDKKDKDLLTDLIRDRLDNAHLQASLGISYALDNELKQKLAVEDSGVLVVQTWEDGPSHKAGLLSYVAARKYLEQSRVTPSQPPPESKIGDIIQAVNGVYVSNPKEMFREVRKYIVGEQVVLRVKRGDSIREFSLTLGQAQAYPDSYNIPIGCRIKINKGT